MAPMVQRACILLGLALMACESPSAIPAEDDWDAFDGRIRGVQFNPESPARAEPLDPWLESYDDPTVRAAVLLELRALRQIARLSHVVLFQTATRHLSWPDPEPGQLARLLRFVDDANAEGLRVAMVLSHPCMIPNSAVPAGYTPVHVGGHARGEVVNGETLHWDVPRCEDTYVTDAIHYFDAILGALATRRRSDGIAYVVHGGTPHRAYGLEMRFDSAFRFLDLELDYLRQVLPHMRAHGVPVGVAALPWLAEVRYEFLDNLTKALPIESLDVIDITSWNEFELPVPDVIDPSAIVAKVGVANAHRIVLSDFRVHSDEDPAAGIRMATQIEWTRDFGFKGYWLWRYKADDFRSLRANGSVGVDPSGFRQPLVDVLRADAF